MTRIFKYPLEVESRQLIQIPEGGKVLHLGDQNGLPMIWVEVEPDRKHVTRVFRTVTTGEVFNSEDSLYIGSHQLGVGDAWYVMHLYEQLPHAAPPDPIEGRFQEDMIQLREELTPAIGLVA